MNFQEFKSKYQKAPVEEYPNKVTDAPLVSVCVVTYQHKDYVRQCLDGILMQKTDFPFEVLLGEDASTDGTREICIEYAERYPDKIRLFLHERANNIHINGSPTGRFNFLYNLYSARGEYIALCEGDDYWKDTLKLQKQIDILNDITEVQVVYHDVHVIGKNKRTLNHPQNSTGYFTLIDTLQGKQGSTLSMVFRKSAIQKINLATFLGDLSIGDWSLECLCMIQGKGYYINEVMGCYRMEGLGVSNNLNRTTYFDVRQKVAERLLALDKSDQNTRIIQSFLNRILLLRLYHNFVNASWSKLGEDIRELSRKFTLRSIVVSGMNWKKHFRITHILLNYPLGFLLGVKNMMIKKISQISWSKVYH